MVTITKIVQARREASLGPEWGQTGNEAVDVGNT
jgi:hypothetical protein